MRLGTILSPLLRPLRKKRSAPLPQEPGTREMARLHEESLQKDKKRS